MKKRIIGLCAVLFALVIAFTVTYAQDEENFRYHQHIEAAEKAVCQHDAPVLCTHLPLVQIHTGGTPIPGLPIYDETTGRRIGYTTAADGSGEIVCGISVTDSPTNNNHLADQPHIQSSAKIRIRGNSSRQFDKKGYSITLITENGENNPQPVMGMNAHHEWVLHGPFLDKTLIRNYLCYNLAGEIMGYAPNVRFCEVVIDGEYHGLYLMVETITAGKDGTRLEISVDKKDNAYSGYILRLDRGSDNPMKNIEPFSIYAERISNGHIDIVYPGTANLNEELRESIRQDFSDFEHMLYTFDFDHSEYGYAESVDVDSFVDYFLFNEFTCNYDALSYSTYIYKGIDGKYRMCVWDFNNAFDNYQEQPVVMEMFTLQECLWYTMMIKDEDFTEAMITRYRELRQTYFSEEYLNDYIDDTIAYLGDAIDRNYEKWGYVFESDKNLLYPITRNLRSYDASVEQLKSFIAQRGAWMDENIEILRQYSAYSKTKLYKEHTR